ncbi:MAG TPA: outer membrane protein assembly factor BamD [Pyrinomonadaceae bacterium]
MRVSYFLTFVLLLVFCVSAPAAFGQGVRSGPDPSTLRDPDLERDSHHNLEVAKNYFKLKKAYVAALKRCEEIIAGNPNFAKIEEVLLMAGQSSLWLSQNKGKQSPNLYVSFDGGEKKTLTSEQFREMGVGYLKKLVNDYPDSPFAKEAQAELSALDAVPKQP